MKSARTVLTALVIGAATLGLATPAFASGGSGGGGGGGGGTGGGGTGGGGGTTVSVGSIRTVSAAATCTAGTSLGVQVRKGFQKRVELQMTGVGAPLPSGLTTLSGRWEVHLNNVTNGTSVLAMASSLGSGSFVWTSLGSTVPVGVSTLSFTADRRDFGSTLEPGLPLGPLLERCTATLTVVGA